VIRPTAASVSSSDTTLPLASTRSCTSTTAPGTISGAGSLLPCTENTPSIDRPATRPAPRIIASATPCPAVATSPTRAPRRSRTAFVPMVVPWPKRSVRWSIAGRPTPAVSASSLSPASTPATGSSLADKTFALRWFPCRSTRTQSVNVPPMSTPT
jgi:hypothetical protein